MFKIALRPVILVLLLWLSGLGAAVQFAKIAVPFADFRGLYPDVGAGAGWLLSIISVVGIFLGMTAGILAAKFGYLKLLVWGLILGAAVSFWQSFLPSFPVMLFSRLIEGFSHLSIVVIAPTLIAQISSDRFRGMGMTLWSTFFGVGFAVIAWGGVPFATTHGISGILSAHAVFMLVVAVCLVLGFRGVEVDLPVSNAPLNLASVLTKHIEAYRSPNIAAPAIGWLFYTITFVALLAIIPTALPAESGARLVGILPLISIASSLIIVSYFLSYASATTISVVGFVLAALVCLLMLFGLPIRAGFISLFAMLGLIQGANFAAIVQLNVSAETRALSSGAVAQMGNLGNTVGTPVLLAILGAFGASGLLVTIGGLYVLGGIAHVLFAKRRKKIGL